MCLYISQPPSITRTLYLCSAAFSPHRSEISTPLSGCLRKQSLDVTRRFQVLLESFFRDDEKICIPGHRKRDFKGRLLIIASAIPQNCC